MDANNDELPVGAEPISRRVIGCAFEVSNNLGAGFLESVYENALCMELAAQGIDFQRQVVLDVRYKGLVVGSFAADLVVARSLLVELKAVRCFVPEHEAQVINYLRATGLHVALLLNFGSPRLQVRRLVFEHDDRRLI
ncbi:GxxExxY protein [Candidatus Thiodictyon syntrophicum]|jgi:GxxExxY protein|uniref:GxxExxY protein n=1 Tax=Candidatus Thiodictyon syntrophicum TaxID=1166950 RepID=A0A2K8UCU8_9GAMM|nr:GxxExxY protein [Candidatus Thiodictyon syntrophicum]AUB83403.1 GxxExxY protein [Candidatus Thiodictyon syntrophicum]